MNTNQLFKEILQDIRVELLDEFDKNFERGSFFGTKPWPKSRRPGGKSPLIDSGALRRSIKGEISGNRIAFSSSLPYASIHNSGGTLTVTTKMQKLEQLVPLIFFRQFLQPQFQRGLHLALRHLA